MAYKVVNLDDNILNLRNKVNVVSKFAGDSAALTTNVDSDLVGAINEIDAVFDASANQIKSTGLYVNDAGNITLDAGGGTITLRDDSASFGTLQNSSTNLVVTSTDITLDASDDIFIDADGGNIKFQDGGADVIDFNIAGSPTSMSVTGALSVLTSQAFTVDAAGDINLDAGGGDVILKDDGTQFGSLTNTSGDLIIKSGTTTAVTFASDSATFAGKIHASNGGSLTGTWSDLGTVTTIDIDGGTIDGTTITASDIDINGGAIDGTPIGYASADSARFTQVTTGTISQTGIITLDASNDIILDADGGDVFLMDGGATFGSLANTGGNLLVRSGSTTAATFSGANVTFAGTITQGTALTTTATTVGAAINELKAAVDVADGTATSSSGFIGDPNSLDSDEFSYATKAGGRFNVVEMMSELGRRMVDVYDSAGTLLNVATP